MADRDPDRMSRYFQALALNSGGVPTHRTLYDAAGISRNTAVEYDRLLVNLMVVYELPAWSSNRLKRLVKAARRHISDPSLIAASLRLDRAGILRDGDLLGRMLETFVVAQIRAETAVDPRGPRLFHLRTHDGRHEVDVIAEMPGGAIVGLEVKAGATPTRQDARHLMWLRDQLGDRFAGGAVLHTGPTVFHLDDNVLAIPIASLWN